MAYLINAEMTEEMPNSKEMYQKMMLMAKKDSFKDGYSCDADTHSNMSSMHGGMMNNRGGHMSGFFGVTSWVITMTLLVSLARYFWLKAEK